MTSIKNPRRGERKGRASRPPPPVLAALRTRWPDSGASVNTPHPRAMGTFDAGHLR